MREPSHFMNFVSPYLTVFMWHSVYFESIVSCIIIVKLLVTTKDFKCYFNFAICFFHVSYVFQALLRVVIYVVDLYHTGTPCAFPFFHNLFIDGNIILHDVSWGSGLRVALYLQVYQVNLRGVLELLLEKLVVSYLRFSSTSNACYGQKWFWLYVEYLWRCMLFLDVVADMQ